MTRTPLLDITGSQARRADPGCYACYPPARAMSVRFDESAYRSAARESNDDPLPRPLALQVELVPGLPDELALLRREIELQAPLFDRDRQVQSVHLNLRGGRSLRVSELLAPLELLHLHFGQGDGDLGERWLRLSAATPPERLPLLRGLGIRHLILEVDAQPAAAESAGALLEEARRLDFHTLAVDALAPELPPEALEALLGLRPDRVALRPCGEAFAAPQALSDYVPLGLNHFVAPLDRLAAAQRFGTLRYGLLGFTAGPDCDAIGFGPGALLGVGETYSLNAASPAAYRAALAAGRLPVKRGLALSLDAVLRREIIHALITRAEVDIPAVEARYHLSFRNYFAAEGDALARARDAGLLQLSGRRIVLTGKGRASTLAVAAIFDAYQPDRSARQPLFRAS